MLREIKDWADELACRAGFDRLPAFVVRLAAGIAIIATIALTWSVSGGSTGGAWDIIASAESTISQAPAEAVPPAVSQPSLSSSVTVHVVGEVRRPGVYVLPGGSRAFDAVAAAGGLLGAADQAAINLARTVMDGEQVAVPREGEAPAAATGAQSDSFGGPVGRKVDLNVASEAQLDDLPGIGPSTAKKIIADRTANGPFRTVDDLMRVPGIGPAKFEALKDLVSTG